MFDICVYLTFVLQVGKAGAGQGRKRKSGEQASSQDLQLAGILHIMFLLANDEAGPSSSLKHTHKCMQLSHTLLLLASYVRYMQACPSISSEVLAHSRQC